jgi:hypothetical protein
MGNREALRLGLFYSHYNWASALKFDFFDTQIINIFVYSKSG